MYNVKTFLVVTSRYYVRLKVNPFSFFLILFIYYLFIYQILWTQACAGGMCTKGLIGPIQPVKVDHTTGVSSTPTPFE